MEITRKRTSAGSLVKKAAKTFLRKAIESSNRSRGEEVLKSRLSAIVNDISNQYSNFDIDMSDEFLIEHVRSLHAFQMSLALAALDMLDESQRDIRIVDIGDSAGTHLLYLNQLVMDRAGKNIRTLSVNLDEMAVDRIRKKGLEAICCRAEDLHRTHPNIAADIFLSFETLEHLSDPIRFLHTMAEATECKYYVVTVPFVRKSRVGLHQIRRKTVDPFSAENAHIFELCPGDWDLIFQFSGWEVVKRDLFTLYPYWSPLSLAKYFWRKYSFEGYYGAVLKKSNRYSRLYGDW